ncbi:hypothetical protein RR46_01115 [Papilio xuthus]|uniref:C2H2-type domain-containing protein n=1 Tax=Papilio xuthus TaxID=66420 RepID=A0A0N1PFZ3_PAPXU|nr:hypothetical protein RR46_01115 [Papilio xuthus]
MRAAQCSPPPPPRAATYTRTAQFCAATYTKLKAARIFENIQNMRVVDLRFECDVCHACFTRRCYWKKHLQRQHGVTVPPQRPGRQKTNRQVGELPTSGIVT